jgi:putative nucleotidyltransferase with HDIG domain
LIILTGSSKVLAQYNLCSAPQSMNSLKVKILGLVTAIVVAIITLAAMVNFQLQKQMINSITEHNSQMLSETVKGSIANAMRFGRAEEIPHILSNIKTQEFIKSARILDLGGKILNSSDSGEIGKIVSQDELTALRLRVVDHPSIQAGKNTFSAFSLIRNNPDCHGCHEPSQEVLGVLQINITLDYLKYFLSNFRNNSVTSTALIIILITITISVFLIYYVDKPISLLISSMQQVENGDFSCKPIISSSAEMRLLSTNHNRMVERLRAQMETAISHERELARAQEKLAHHREIHLMNEKLEEQIKEIENLNVSLEERIEEIEEANYKISDLAGELEDKNTNLEKAVAKLSTLYKVGLAINSTMEMSTLFNLIVKTTMDTLQAEIGYIILYEPELRSLRVITLLGHEFSSPEGTLLPMKPSSVSTWVIENRKPLLISDISGTPQFDRYSALGYERKTLICAPLLVKDEIIGTITVVNKFDNSVYSCEELELLNTIAAQAGIAIKNAKLYDEQQKIYMNTIHALVSAIEASDSYTRGHSERVTRYSLGLARRLELSTERMKIIERAAILHDIGKIGIDLSLLHKEGRLSPEDVENLQQHPLIGMKILEPIEFLHDVKLCIGQHHERYDGHGYPHHVAADQLLVESRILAIADAFDAMTSDRPYRKALPVEVAIKELSDNAGTQFDPTMVPHFIELLKSGMFSSRENREPSSSPSPYASA